MSADGGYRKTRASPLDRRRDLDTAVHVELARIYFNVFGPRATARYFTVFSVNIVMLETILNREYRRGAVNPN